MATPIRDTPRDVLSIRKSNVTLDYGLSNNANAVVVGSSIIKKIEEAKKKKYNKIKLVNYVLSYIKNLSSAL